MGFAEVALAFDQVTCLKPATKLVLVALADRSNARGEAWPSLRELARRSGQSERTVMRHIDLLEEMDLISREARYRVASGGGGRRTTNFYRVNLEGIRSGEFLGDNLSPKESCPQSAGQALDDNLSPKQSLGDKNPESLGDSSVTSMNYQQKLSTLPSPPSPHVHGVGSGMDAAAPLGHGSSDPLGTEILNSEEASDASGLSALESARDARPGPGAIARGIAGRSRERAMPSGADWDLISGCLPASMRGLPARYVPEIASMLRERLEAGWSRQALRAALGARALPTEIKFLPGLVKARLADDAPLDAVPPASLVEDAGASLEERARAAQARRTLIDACPLCDEQGWANTGDGSVRRCDHPGVEAAHF